MATKTKIIIGISAIVVAASAIAIYINVQNKKAASRAIVNNVLQANTSTATPPYVGLR